MWHQKDIVQELSAKLDMIHPLVDSELTKYLFVITLVASRLPQLPVVWKYLLATSNANCKWGRLALTVKVVPEEYSQHFKGCLLLVCVTIFTDSLQLGERLAGVYRQVRHLFVTNYQRNNILATKAITNRFLYTSWGRHAFFLPIGGSYWGSLNCL